MISYRSAFLAFVFGVGSALILFFYYSQFVDLKDYSVKQNDSRTRLALKINKQASNINIDELQLALENGSEEAMNALRIESLIRLKSYYTEVLPRLKVIALKELHKRFSIEDFTDWGESSKNSSKSPARKYIDNLSLVNQELGRFLETTAYLLSALYKDTKEGKIFNAESAFADLVSNAEVLLSSRVLLAIPARQYLDNSVLTNLAVVEILEKARSRFVRDYVEINPERVTNNLELITSLSSTIKSTDSTKSIRIFLGNIGQESTPEVRAQVAETLLSWPELRKLAESDKVLSHSIAQFLLLCSVDLATISSPDLSLAEDYYQRALEYYPEVSGKASVEMLIKKKKENYLLQNLKIKKQNSEIKTKTNEDKWLSPKTLEQILGQVIVVGVLLLVLGFIAIRVYVYLRSVKATTKNILFNEAINKEGQAVNVSEQNSSIPTIDMELENDPEVAEILRIAMNR